MYTNIDCNLRNEVGSNACNRIRNTGHVPGVIYGHNFENYSLEFDNSELMKIIRDHGESAIVNVNIDSMNYPAMIKEVQRDPLMGNIMHVDLQQLILTEKIHAAIPILLTGKRSLDNDAILQQQLQKVEIECLPNNVPKNITVDISNLSIGDIIRVSDVEFGEDFSIINDNSEIIASLTYVKQVVTEEENDEEGYGGVLDEEIYIKELDSPNVEVRSED